MFHAEFDVFTWSSLSNQGDDSRQVLLTLIECQSKFQNLCDLSRSKKHQTGIFAERNDARMVQGC